ncbi:MAG: integrin [Acidobacteria bacterium]|nr:integrin [Acidobacteriota bacterium]
MRRSALSVIAVACFGLFALVAHLVAQGTPIRQVAYLKASNPGMYDHFGEGGALPGHTGNTVAISRDGNTIAVGAPHEGSGAQGINGNQNDESAYNAGAVYVYARAGAGWSQQAYVKASNAGRGDAFGSSVALSADGNTMAVAAHFETSSATGVNGNQADNSIPQAGAVYLFTRTGGRWSQQAYLKASNTGEKSEGDALVGGGDGDQFGFSLALSADGTTLAVGASGEDSTGTGINGNQTDNSAVSAGAVYVFRRAGNTWSQQAYVKPATPAMFAAGDLFGFSLGLSADGTTLAVGVYDEGGSSRQVNGPVDNMRGGSGAVYIFTRAGTTWSQQAYLKVSSAEQGDSWGVSMALSDDGNTLATGSVDEDCTATGVNPPGCDTDRMTDVSTGAVAVFGRTGTTWTQQAYLKASNTGAQDWFGIRVALSGDSNTLAVSAANEDSAAQGINGRQGDDSAGEAGAVYFFTRTGATWAQQAYVKASNNEAFDEFGNSVALSRDGRTMVVGARGEDSSAGDNQADNSVDESGAAYVFTR